ncbi:MAG: DUF3291 domain-containing protein [Pseudomonadota bacterium]
MALYHLAQLNIARMKYTLDDPALKDFVDALDPVNASADAYPGFIWRLQTDDGDATDIRIYDDDHYLVNMSVWRDLDTLKSFVASQQHGNIMRRRSEWFEKMDVPFSVLWWVPEHHRPSVPEAQDKLDALREDGPTPAAFNFESVFPPPGED